MGRGKQTTLAAAEAVTRPRGASFPTIIHRPLDLDNPNDLTDELSQYRQEGYEDYVHENLNYRELTTTDEVKELVKVLKDYKIKQISLDFETARGDEEIHGVDQGRLRLIQIGIDHPKFGGRRQWVIDCDQADPRALRSVLSDWKVEKLIHWSPFEQIWSQVHLGVAITNVYDTGMAFQSIAKELERWEKDPQKGQEAIADVVIGWQGWHPAKMGVLADRYLGIDLPKVAQESDWRPEVLDEEQKVYAALDVSVPFDLAPIAREMAEKLDIERRIDWRCGNARKEAAEVVEPMSWRARELCWQLSWAEDKDQLDGVWRDGQSLKTGIGFEAGEELTDFYQSRLLELS